MGDGATKEWEPSHQREKAGEGDRTEPRWVGPGWGPASGAITRATGQLLGTWACTRQAQRWGFHQHSRELGITKGFIHASLKEALQADDGLYICLVLHRADGSGWLPVLHPTCLPHAPEPHSPQLTSVSLLNCLNMRPTSWANSWGEL